MQPQEMMTENCIMLLVLVAVLAVVVAPVIHCSNSGSSSSSSNSSLSSSSSILERTICVVFIFRAMLINKFQILSDLMKCR